MSLTPPPPIPTVPIAGADGMVTTEWWRWFHQFLTYVNNGQQDTISNLVSTTPAMELPDPPLDPAQAAFLSEWIAPPPTVTFGEITGTVPAGAMLPLPHNEVYQGDASGQPAAVSVTAALTASPGVTGSGKVVLDTSPSVSGLSVTGSFTATGLVTNADLANSSITIAGHSVSLGGTQALAASDLSNGTTGSGAVVLATSPTLVTPALGTPSAIVLTNATGTAASLTAGNVTTNANLTGPITSIGNATSIASQTGTGSKFVVDTSPTISGLTVTGATTVPNGSITSTGHYLIGTATAFTVGGLSTALNIYNVFSSQISSSQFSADANGSVLAFGKSRGSPSTAGAVVSADIVAAIQGYGDDGSTNGAISIKGALTRYVVDATVSTGIVPMRIDFSTMNSGGTFAERMRLGSDGSLLLGSTTNAGAGAFKASAAITAQSGTAIPAGGTAGAGFTFSSTANFGVFFGSGAPTLSAAKGSLYLRSDGTSTSTRAYINTNGSTTWTNVTTAA